MSVIIGSARIDENGNLSGGRAGDQSGKEVSIQPFYMHKKGWIAIRAKESAVANAISIAMQQACGNDFIGYDQNERTSVIAVLKRVKSFDRVDTFCEADCSSLVRGCCIQAGFDPGNFTTANELSVLTNTKRFTSFIVTSEKQLQNGDILVTKTKGHTVVVVSSDNKPASTAPVTQPVINAKAEAAKSKDASLAGTYEVTASSLNLRLGPTTNHSIVAKLPKGTTCKMYGYYTRKGDVDWYYVVANGEVGFVSSEYLRKI